MKKTLLFRTGSFSMTSRHSVFLHRVKNFAESSKYFSSVHHVLYVESSLRQELDCMNKFWWPTYFSIFCKIKENNFLLENAQKALFALKSSNTYQFRIFGIDIRNSEIVKFKIFLNKITCVSFFLSSSSKSATIKSRRYLVRNYCFIAAKLQQMQKK